MAVDVLNEDILVKKKLNEAVVRILNVRQKTRDEVQDEEHSWHYLFRCFRLANVQAGVWGLATI
jgi:hypothetical protein